MIQKGNTIIQTCSNVHGPRCDEDFKPKLINNQNSKPSATAAGGARVPQNVLQSTPPVRRCRGGTCPTKRSLRAPLQCVPVKSKKSKFNCKFQNQNHKMFTRTNLRFNMSQPFSFVKDFCRREIIEPSSTSVRLHSTTEVYRYAAAPVHSQPSSAILIAC